METLRCYLNNIKKGTFQNIKDGNLLVPLILDSTTKCVTDIIKMKRINHVDLEQITRTLCYCLHIGRDKLIKSK